MDMNNRAIDWGVVEEIQKQNIVCTVIDSKSFVADPNDVAMVVSVGGDGTLFAGGANGSAGTAGAAVADGYLSGSQAGKAGARQSILGKGSPISNTAPDDQSTATPQAVTTPVAQQPTVTPATTTPTSQPVAARPVTTAPTLKAPPVAPGNLDSFKKSYSSLDPAEREQLKKDLEVIDDQDRLATGTNESLDDIIKLARS
jgi:hypothetical protein